MRPQGLGGMIVAGKFGFGKRGVDFAVANMVHQDNGPAFAAFEFRDQMMQALRDTAWDRAAA